MSTKIPVVAIFDIGKTNKKLLVFDTQYNVVKEESARFEEIVDEDNFPCEDIDKLSAWILSKFNELQSSDKFLLKGVNFSTYGASVVYIDNSEKRIGHLYNYLKPYPDELMHEFKARYADDAGFAAETCSPVMGHLNAGMQLYWLKYTRPEIYSRVSSVLHFPQYLSFLLTGKKAAEMTNVGCHSLMWNFQTMKYHSWLEKEAIRSKLAEITPGSYAVKVKSKQSADGIAIGTGLHDSSAAIIPYLSSFTEPFVILSTGTWTISLNPFNKQLPGDDELAKGCVSYLSYHGNPVKTTMLFAGNDHDQQVAAIANHFNVDVDFFKTVSADHKIISQCWQEAENAALLQQSDIITSATTPSLFQQRNMSDFDSAARAYHQLLADIVYQQMISTNMVLKGSDVQNIYVDGGFCRNNIYMQYIADAFPGKKVYATSMIQGTSLGAALAIHEHWNPDKLPKGLLQLKRWNPSVTDNAHI